MEDGALTSIMPLLYPGFKMVDVLSWWHACVKLKQNTSKQAVVPFIEVLYMHDR